MEFFHRKGPTQLHLCGTFFLFDPVGPLVPHTQHKQGDPIENEQGRHAALLAGFIDILFKVFLLTANAKPALNQHSKKMFRIRRGYSCGNS